MKKRVISAVVFLLISLPFVYIGGIPFYFLSMIISLLAFKELLDLVTKDYWTRLVYYICFLFLLGSNIGQNNLNNILDFKVLSIVILILCFLQLLNYKSKKYNLEKNFFLISGIILLACSFASMIILRNISLFYFIYIFLITTMTDIFAQFIGILFGKHKVNEISPNKTWKGCLGGLFFGTLISTLFYLIFINQDINIFILIFFTMFLSVVAQLGDLFFSLVKRSFKIKDFSNIMPGHGGLLDRFDSAIFVALAFIYFINFL